jgi:hypothetical protein
MIKNNAHSRQPTADWKVDGDDKCPIVVTKQNAVDGLGGESPHLAAQSMSFESSRSPWASRNLVSQTGLDYTTLPIQERPIPNEREEWGRYAAVFQRFGIKRGTLYNITADGMVKSVLLRRKGNKHGCRLWYLPSISKYLNSLMQQQDGGARE